MDMNVCLFRPLIFPAYLWYYIYVGKAAFAARGAILLNTHKKNEYVRYGANGVCLIEDVTKMKVAGEERNFYVLRPVASNSSTIYVPADNETLTERMKRVLTKAEIDGLITTTRKQSINWVNDRNDRREYFHSIIAKCDRSELLLLISCIYKKRHELVSVGKRLAASDDEALKLAERLIEDEFSFSLGLGCDEIGEYIRGKLGAV